MSDLQTQSTKNKFISVLKFCNETGIDRQKIYRLIREHKLQEGKDFIVVEKTVRRIQINNDINID
jgi:hypothetical protein